MTTLLGATIRLLLTGAIRVYRTALSPVLPPACRYWPSCSEYSLEAVERHGPLRGAWLALRRIGRCHPWGGHGVDPVPSHGVGPVPSQRSSRSSV